MALPTPPLALSATYLTVLQARPAVSAPADAPLAPEGKSEEPGRPSSPHIGRGRLVDILV